MRLNIDVIIVLVVIPEFIFTDKVLPKKSNFIPFLFHGVVDPGNVGDVF